MRRALARGRLTLQIVPTVLRVRRALRTVPDLRDVVTAVEESERARRPLWRWTGARGTEAAAARALRLLRQPVDNCVPRALTTFGVLTRHGHPAELVSGVAKVAGQLRGHAWVESEGEVLSGVTGQKFEDIFRTANHVRQS